MSTDSFQIIKKFPFTFALITMSKKQERSKLIVNFLSRFQQNICRNTVPFFLLILGFSLLLPGFVKANYGINRSITIVKSQTASHASSLLAITEAEADQEEEADQLKSIHNNTHNIFNIEADYASNLTKKFLELANDLNRRPRLQYFMLYHCWKSHLS